MALLCIRFARERSNKLDIRLLRHLKRIKVPWARPAWRAHHLCRLRPDVYLQSDRMFHNCPVEELQRRQQSRETDCGKQPPCHPLFSQVNQMLTNDMAISNSREACTLLPSLQTNRMLPSGWVFIDIMLEGHGHPVPESGGHYWRKYHPPRIHFHPQSHRLGRSRSSPLRSCQLAQPTESSLASEKVFDLQQPVRRPVELGNWHCKGLQKAFELRFWVLRGTSMAALLAMAAPGVFKYPVVLSKSDFTGTAVRQASGPSCIRLSAPLVVRAIGYDEELRRIARIIASPGRGVFALDESSVTCGKKLASVGMENTEMNRRAYRQMLVTTPGLGQYISGATLFEETLYQNTIQGKKFVDCLGENGVIPGVKVDRGLVSLPGSNNEYYCQGLDNLHSRTSQFYRAGARFAKWRTVISIPNGPSALAVQRAGIDSALFAAIAQANGLVPIIEAEILLDGDHGIDSTLDVSERVWAEVFYYLAQHRVLLEAIILKPSMVTHGAQSGMKAPPEQVTDYTLTLLRRVVPNCVAGILFPSGGQSEVEATVNLNALNQRPCQWHLSFSYARALQNTVLRTWNGQTQNVRAAQEALMHRARLNSLAQQGRYPGELETDDSRKPLYEPNYVL